MHPNAILLTAALAATGLAAPAPAAAVSMQASVPDWTLEGLVRHCNPQNSYCQWNFVINTHLGPAPTTTPCTLGVRGGSRGDVSGVVCGAFAVSAGWSGQFGDGNGFVTLAVVDYARRLIAWPAYTDAQLVNDRVVVPDRSWPVSELK